jgi:Zn-dependent protease with chaperone function
MKEQRELKEYSGTLFDPALPSGRAPAFARCVGASLEVRCDRLHHSWSPVNLDLFRGGAAGKLIFFRPQGQVAISFCTDDETILTDAALCAAPSMDEKIGLLRRDAMNRQLAFVLGLAVVVALLSALVWGVASESDHLWSGIARSISPKAERSLGDKLYPHIEQQFPPVPDEALEAEFRSFADRVLGVVPDKSFQFTLHLSARPEVNAFALPGGHIVTLAGLVLEAQTPEEILGVLAHEAAHVTERHVMRHLARAMGVGVTFSLLLGDASGTLAGLGQLGDLLLSRSYSRDLEREADARGISYLVAANVDPRGLLTFFERMAKKAETTEKLLEERNRTKSEKTSAKKGDSRYSEATAEHVKMLEKALSTHPEHAERIARLQTLTGETRAGYDPVAFDLKGFQLRLTAIQKGD